MNNLKKSVYSLAICALAITSFSPEAQAKSKTLLQKTIEGDVWKVNFYPKKMAFHLKKNGKAQCKDKVIKYKSFLACATKKMGSNYKDEIYKAIKKKL